LGELAFVGIDVAKGQPTPGAGLRARHWAPIPAVAKALATGKTTTEFAGTPLPAGLIHLFLTVLPFAEFIVAATVFRNRAQEG
jgi:hypothetical protein